MKETFDFLCGKFGGVHFIYGIKNDIEPWHYFEEQDSLSSAHGSLPALLDTLIGTLDKVRTIKVPLFEHQWSDYYRNKKFIFKDKELKSYMQFVDDESEKKASNSKSLRKTTDQLVFISGQSNPLLFLNEFEKCRDIKTERDKMFKIRNFVDACHKVEFSELYFKSEWSSVRQTFIRKYTSTYTENKKKDLNIDFDEETNLRCFFELKLKAFTSYTTLAFFNQVEMILHDLPISVEKLFLVNEVMTKTKAEILDFCDSVQDIVQAMWENEKKENELPVIPDPLNEMEVFTFNPDLPMSPMRLSGSGTKNQKGPSGKKRRIQVISASSDSDGTSQSSTDSQKIVSGKNIKVRGVAPSRGVVKRGRGRPRKNLVSIPEENSDSVVEYLNEISDASSSKSMAL